jgi:hypothetical protein
MIKKQVEVVSLHDFKTNLCKYMHLLQTGKMANYIVRRYKKDVAIVNSIKILKLNRDAEAGLEGIRNYKAAFAAHKAQRARIKAMALTHWPVQKYYGLKRPDCDLIQRRKRR